MSGNDQVARSAHSGAATRTLGFAVLLTGSSGFLDAYTYLERGGVFANAQTANVVLGAIAFIATMILTSIVFLTDPTFQSFIQRMSEG